MIGAAPSDAPTLGPDSGRDAVLLLSGGIDSAALAALIRPAWALVVDYAAGCGRGSGRERCRCRTGYDRLISGVGRACGGHGASRGPAD